MRIEEVAVLPDIYYDFVRCFPSVNTRDAYRKDLQDFVAFAKQTNPEIWVLSDFIGYRDHLMTNTAPATVNRKIASIRSFLAWCMGQGLIGKDPSNGLKLPKIQIKEPTLAFTDVEVCKILSKPDSSTSRGAGHRLILSLLFNLGLRRSEITRITLGDLREDRGQLVLTVSGKGNKNRELPINDQIRSEIEAYLNLKDPAGFERAADNFLFGVQKRPLNSTSVFRIVTRYSKEAGIVRRVGPHSCRATAISHLLDTQKVPIRDVADFAGHSSISTTAGYDKKRKGIQDSAAHRVNYES